jgi:hypothetical protein
MDLADILTFLAGGSFMGVLAWVMGLYLDVRFTRRALRGLSEPQWSMVYEILTDKLPISRWALRYGARSCPPVRVSESATTTTANR